MLLVGVTKPHRKQPTRLPAMNKQVSSQAAVTYNFQLVISESSCCNRQENHELIHNGCKSLKNYHFACV